MGIQSRAPKPVAVGVARGDNGYVLDPIGLDPKPLKPDLPGAVVVRQSQEQLIDALAADLMFQSRACVQAFGDFHLAVSADAGLGRVHRRLMYDPSYRSIPWKRTHLWQTHERCVSMDNPARGWPEIHDLIVEPSDIPHSQAHAIDTTGDRGVDAYERELTECLEWREKGHDRLDCVVLSMDRDGQIAGLIAGSNSGDDDDRLIIESCDLGPNEPAVVTMTRRLINASRFVAIHAVGEEVRPVIEQIVARSACAADVPVVGIDPVGGELRWYVDSAACGG